MSASGPGAAPAGKATELAHVAAWTALPFLAVVNGFVRDTTYGRGMSPIAAHSVSVLPLIAAIGGWAAYVGARWPLAGRGAGIRAGLGWVVLTVAFEFGLGAARGLALPTMLADYDLLHGRLWPMVPLATALTPEMVRRYRARARPADTAS